MLVAFMPGVVSCLQAQSAVKVIPDSIFYFTDSRDGNSYKAITFQNISWMSEPLRFKTKDSKCYGNRASCKFYGRMYNWDDANHVCPKGWKLPSVDEWNTLIQMFGGYNNAGGSIADTDSSLFKVKFGFPPNMYGRFADDANEMHFWSSSQNDTNTAWHYFIEKDKLPYISKTFISKNYSLNCLCVKNETEDTTKTPH